MKKSIKFSALEVISFKKKIRNGERHSLGVSGLPRGQCLPWGKASPDGSGSKAHPGTSEP